MKLGKTKLKRILSEETGIPPQDIADFGSITEIKSSCRSVVIR